MFLLTIISNDSLLPPQSAYVPVGGAECGLETLKTQSGRLAVLEEEESRESAEEVATIQQAQALLEQLTMGGVPTMPPGFAPSDI